MTTFDHTPFPHAGAARSGIVARAAVMAANVWTAFRNRRELYRLGEMSDFELADIGLTRGDLHVAIDAPLGHDPTSRLGALARLNQIELERAARRIC